MRTASGVFIGSAAALGMIALVPARAAAPVVIEKSLLGVRILQTYHDVLAKWGQPTLVLRGGERFLYTPATTADGADLGGIQGVSYEGGGGGTPGAGGPPSMGRGAGSGGGPGGGAGTASAAPIMKGKMSGGGPGSGGPPGMGGGGGAGGGGSDVDVSFGESGNYSWVYYKNHVLTDFLFNLEGRVLGIMERGDRGGMPTQRGLMLGDNVEKLYDVYGWPDTIQDTDPGFTLDYGSKYHAKFAVIKNKVVGIGVVLEENTKPPFFPVNGSGGGASGGGGKMGGRGGPGSGGMMGGGGGRPGGAGGSGAGAK